MRAVNSFRTVSQLCRGNETVSAVRGASSGPAGQLTARAARGAARRASVLAMLPLGWRVGHWRVGWRVCRRRVASMALTLTRCTATLDFGAAQRASLVSQGDGLALEMGLGRMAGALYTIDQCRAIWRFLEASPDDIRQSYKTLVSYKSASFSPASSLGCWAPLRGAYRSYRSGTATSHQLSVYTISEHRLRGQKSRAKTHQRPEAKSQQDDAGPLRHHLPVGQSPKLPR